VEHLQCSGRGVGLSMGGGGEVNVGIDELERSVLCNTDLSQVCMLCLCLCFPFLLSMCLDLSQVVCGGGVCVCMCVYVCVRAYQ